MRRWRLWNLYIGIALGLMGVGAYLIFHSKKVEARVKVAKVPTPKHEVPKPQDGPYFEYFENGKIKIEEMYKNGNRISSKSYYESGKVKTESSMNWDTDESIDKVYDEKGNLRSEKYRQGYYSSGNIVDKKYFPDGKPQYYSERKTESWSA